MNIANFKLQYSNNIIQSSTVTPRSNSSRYCIPPHCDNMSEIELDIRITSDIYIYVGQSDTMTKCTSDANINIPHINDKMLTVSNFDDQYYMYLKR